ncbi:MAG TPA: kelch repeat-containing protein [Nocardioides sp.]|nr:kelch repeat-containing protein [Nocardioides sp.]
MTRRLPRSLLFFLLFAPVLAACGGGSSSPAAPATSGTATAPSSSAPAASSSPTPFTPHTATARVAAWHLPYAAGRQAVVPMPDGGVIVAGGLVAGDASTDRVVRVDAAHARVSPLPSLPVPVHDVAGGLAGTTPLVVGGGNATEQDVVQAWQGDTWRVVGHLPTTRSDLSIVQRGSTPVVVGGYDGASVPTTLLALSASGDSHSVGRLVQGVRYAATAVAGHTAYVFGGEVGGAELGSVQAVDLRTGHTRVAARLPVPLGHAMAATVGTRILLMGGRVAPDRQTSEMWWFDPATGRFTRAGSLPHPLSDAAVATNGRRVWLLGGEESAVTDQVVFVNVR